MKVTLVPSPPSEGWHSMDRYWRELQCRSGIFHDEGIDLVDFLTAPPPETSRASRWKRAAERYLVYPMQARRLRGRAILHLLDHSHADVLAHVEPTVKRIVTVHDLAPLRDSSDLSPAQLARFRKRVMNLQRADLILTDSEFTARDVIKF